METLDLRKTLRALYAPSAKAFSLVEVPPLQFIMIDGTGDPNSAQAYQQALEALYPVSYGLKFALKKAGVADWSVMPLEGLWWAEDMNAFVTGSDRGAWHWTMMIAQPEVVTAEHVEQVAAEARRKKDLPALDRLRLETYAEGPSAQIMYLGAYSDEGPTIARLHAWIAEQGYGLRGKHHEIYLGDPRRSAPEKLKTVIRQPVEKR
ncbi:MAG: GyrI-like domain-containing protein [Anaerolineae bacterium]